MRTRLFLIASLILTACAGLPAGDTSTSTAVAQAPPTEYGRFPAPSGSLTLGPESSLMDALAALQEVTGLTFSVDTRTRGQLQGTVVGIDREVTVPPESAYPWVGALLLQNGFVMADLTGNEPRLVGVYSRHSQSAPLAIEIPVEMLDDYVLHPALMIQTSVHLEHVDVRTLGNSLRAISSDASGHQGVIPVGNTNTVLLHGSVRQVVELVETLQRINEVEGAKRAASKVSASGDSPG
jgi:hypothetical protein